MPRWSLGLLKNAHPSVTFSLIYTHWPVRLRKEEKGSNLGWRKMIAKWCSTFDIFAGCKWYNKWYANLHQLLDLRAHSFRKWVWSSKYGVSNQSLHFSRVDYPLGLESEFVCRLWSVWCRNESLTAFPPRLLYSPADQRTFSYTARTMRLSCCTASSGQWWRSWWAFSLWSWPSVPRAWRSRQKPWRSASSPNAGGGLWEAKRRGCPVSSTRLPCRAHIWWRRRWKGPQQASTRPLLQWHQKQARMEDSGTHRLPSAGCSNG